MPRPSPARSATGRARSRAAARAPTLAVRPALTADAPAVAALHARVGEELTTLHGKGRWSWAPKENAVRRAIESSTVLVAEEGAQIVGTLTLTRKKPWAIDLSYFAAARTPLYLLSMAVLPERQRQGIGRRLLAAAVQTAGELGADVLRLDAFDAAAGAGGFYARCGFRETGRASYRDVPLVYYALPLPRDAAASGDEQRLEGPPAATRSIR